MKLVGFIWLEEIVQKLISKHSIEVTEVIELSTINLASILLKKDSERAKMYMRHMGVRMRGVIWCAFLYESRIEEPLSYQREI